MKTEKKELSSPHLKNLQKELEKLEKGEIYLELERRKLIKQKEKIRVKIKKEKEILKLKGRINFLQRRKKN